MKQKYYTDLPPKDKKTTKINMKKLREVVRKLRPILERELEENEKIQNKPVNMAF